MIDFSDWLRQIIGYCKIIAEDRIIRRSWIEGERSETSVTDYDELIEQIFDDLDADEMARSSHELSSSQEKVLGAVRDFLGTLNEFNDRVEAGEISNNPEVILASRGWKAVQGKAARVLSEASANDQ